MPQLLHNKYLLFNDTYQIYVSQWSYFKLWVSRSKVKGQGHDISRNAQMKITKTGISQAIFRLEQNLNYHNVVLLKAYLHGIINFRYNYRFKSSLYLKMAAI